LHDLRACDRGPLLRKINKPDQRKPRKQAWIGLDFLGKELGFPWIPSSESGFFNWLWAIPRKKFSIALRRGVFW
jgi:hypothetical protein